jgi:hypothetical protein
VALAETQELRMLDDPAAAQAHYATGVRIAESSLPDGFGGVLGWGWIDNRPFLRCLHGLTISTWRLEQHTEAEALCWALLWLNPADNQGARGLLCGRRLALACSHDEFIIMAWD